MNATEVRASHADKEAMGPSRAGEGNGTGTYQKEDARYSKGYGIKQDLSVIEQKLVNTDNDSSSGLTKCQRYGVLFAVVLVTFLGRVERLLISPFYPKYAVQRNVTETGIGFVFGCLDFATLFSCIIWSHLLYCINVKYVYTLGIVGTSIFSALFSILSIIDNTTAFLALSIVFRIMMGLFSGAYFVAEAAILVSLFPANVASINAALEASAGLGFMTGPLIGAVLYQFGGFNMPFIVTSACILVVGLSILCYLPSVHEHKEKYQSSTRKMITIPLFTCSIGFDLIYMMVTAVVYAFFSLHLEIYQVTPIEKGAATSGLGCGYIISSLISGLLLDKKPKWNVPMLICSMSLYAVSVSLLGPAPYYNITHPPLWLLCVCWTFLGIFGAAGTIACIAVAYQTVKEAGFPDTVETYGSIAGIVKAYEALGSGIGAVIGGIMYQAMGWEWLLTAMAYLISAHILIVVLAVIWHHLQNRKPTFESTIEHSCNTEETTLINCN